MSVFRVKLNNESQGLLDLDSNGTQKTVSIQRTVYVMGPNRQNRLLKDGDTFTDCNYWKKFTKEVVGLENAFIEVVTDDGSIYSEVPSENVFPYVWSITADSDTSYTDNVIDILEDAGSSTITCQITNLNTTTGDDVRIRLNGAGTAIFDLKAGSTFTGDISLTKIEVDNQGTNNVDIQVIATISAGCSS
jgi:hypothetical protein